MKWILLVVIAFRLGGAQLIPLGPAMDSLEECDARAPQIIKENLGVHEGSPMITFKEDTSWVCVRTRVQPIP